MNTKGPNTGSLAAIYRDLLPGVCVIGREAAILQPITTTEVCAAIAAIGKRGDQVIFAAGRQDGLPAGAVGIDLSKMRTVTVDAGAGLVTVQGGCRLRDMDAACRPHGMACVAWPVTYPDIDVVSLSLCGGCGYLSRQHGLAVDNIVSAEVVLADGTAATATKDNEHSELFGALCGGGSRIAVVVSITMRAHRVKYAFSGVVVNLALTLGSAIAVVRSWATWVDKCPRSVSGACVLACGAPAVSTAIVELAVDQRPTVTPLLRDLPNLVPLSGCGLSGAFGACASFKPVQRTEYHVGTQRMLEGFQRTGHCHRASLIVPALSGQVAEVLVDLTRNRHPNSSSVVILIPLGGAVAEAEVDGTAYSRARTMPNAFSILIYGQYDPSANDRAKVVAWVRTLKAALGRHGAIEAMDILEGNGVAVTRPAVHEMKDRYDPHDLFLGGNGDAVPATAQQRHAHRVPPPKKKSPKAVYRL